MLQIKFTTKFNFMQFILWRYIQQGCYFRCRSWFFSGVPVLPIKLFWPSQNLAEPPLARKSVHSIHELKHHTYCTFVHVR